MASCSMLCGRTSTEFSSEVSFSGQYDIHLLHPYSQDRDLQRLRGESSGGTALKLVAPFASAVRGDASLMPGGALGGPVSTGSSCRCRPPSERIPIMEGANTNIHTLGAHNSMTPKMGRDMARTSESTSLAPCVV
ncbi:hypothetical protein PG996_008646 [Apiospora saccharicola]|uniref:Uncharacterized protein n=1 Tax=Apiospora saccharicola TaxID=335842 RepID=A0ABR1V1P2_9PEZI